MTGWWPERGFKGSCSTVLRYVREWRRANREPGDGYVEPAWAPGCAQMDFGRAGAAWLASGSTTIAWWSRSRIRASYVASLPAENAECVR